MPKFAWAIIIAILVGVQCPHAAATSVALRDHRCPVCGKSSVHPVLLSYSNFGPPPARDGGFMPVGSRVEICPHDLYASWNDRWDDPDDSDKQRLGELLKHPVVILTSEEMRLAGGHLEALRESGWWELLWARTCDQARHPDPDHALQTALAMYYHGQRDADEQWIRELSNHYRDRAIEALAKSDSKRHGYLRAELLRLAGRRDESAALFRKLVGELGKAASQGQQPDDETEESAAITRLSEEGLLLIESEGLTSAKIAEWILMPLPAPPDRERKNIPADWSRHGIALQVLVTRATTGDAEASGILWARVQRNAERLVTLEESLAESPGAPKLESLRKAGEPWVGWFDTLAADAKSGKLPVAYKNHPNRERILHLFQRFGPPSPDIFGGQWRKSVMLPAVVKADNTGKLPEWDISRNDLAIALASLASESPAGREAVLKGIVRLLKELPEPVKKPAYGFRYAAAALATHSRDGAALSSMMDGKWQSRWWKLVAEYATGKPGTGPVLAAHPLIGKKFRDDGNVLEDLAWKLFAARRDPIWKEKVLKTLRVSPWVGNEALDYAISLRDDAVNAELQRRIVRIRNKEIPGIIEELAQFEIQSIEADTLKTKLAALPVSLPESPPRSRPDQ